MAAATMGTKTARLDLRMDPEQKETIGRAAAASGMTISQWSLDRLMASARADLLEASVVRMSARSFDAFARLLEEPQSAEFAAFAAGKTIWEQ